MLQSISDPELPDTPAIDVYKVLNQTIEFKLASDKAVKLSEKGIATAARLMQEILSTNIVLSDDPDFIPEDIFHIHDDNQTADPSINEPSKEETIEEETITPLVRTGTKRPLLESTPKSCKKVNRQFNPPKVADLDKFHKSILDASKSNDTTENSNIESLFLENDSFDDELSSLFEPENSVNK